MSNTSEITHSKMPPKSYLEEIIKSNLSPPDQLIPAMTKEINLNNTVIKNDEETLLYANDAITCPLKQQTETYNNITHYQNENLCLASLSAPYHKTPPEIISLIFQLLIPVPNSQIPIPKLKDWINTLNTFTHVSKHWCVIAITDPILWKSLVLNIKNKELNTATFLLQRWVSNMHMDNLHLTINNQFYSTSCHNLFNLYKTLDNCKCLKKFTIFISHAYPQLHLIKQDYQHSIPSLLQKTSTDTPLGLILR